jgi:predicted transcriptional regulator
MDKKLLELTVEMVQTQVSLNKMSGEEVEAALIRVYNALHKIQEAEREGRSIAIDGHPAEGIADGSQPKQLYDPRASIMEDKVVCLECGAEFRQLTANHLKSHDLSPREYKKRYGFPMKQALAAIALTQFRSKSAKKRGLPPNLQQYLAGQRQRKEAGTEKAANGARPRRSVRRRTP